ncbi:MAG: sel1 repeat family protein [Flavobacteriaceae bacterium]|nr:sel1 repeat family protein [Flavobacteriaceae bacterium]
MQKFLFQSYCYECCKEERHVTSFSSLVKECKYSIFGYIKNLIGMKKNSLKMLTVLLVLFQMLGCRPSTQQLSKQANELLDQHQFEAAFPLLEKAAEMGDAQAQYNLGLIYRDCCSVTGMEPNYDKSLAWIGKAADQGHTEALATLKKNYR